MGGMDCRAFGMKARIDIPEEIMNGLNDHTQPYPGDNGRQYVPKDADPPPEDW